MEGRGGARTSQPSGCVPQPEHKRITTPDPPSGDGYAIGPAVGEAGPVVLSAPGS